jgi:hypothetical protein
MKSWQIIAITISFMLVTGIINGYALYIRYYGKPFSPKIVDYYWDSSKKEFQKGNPDNWINLYDAQDNNHTYCFFVDNIKTFEEFPNGTYRVTYKWLDKVNYVKKPDNETMDKIHNALSISSVNLAL